MKRFVADEELPEIELAFESTDEIWCALRGQALDDARPALKRRSDAFNKTLAKYRNMDKNTNAKDLAAEVKLLNLFKPILMIAQKS